MLTLGHVLAALADVPLHEVHDGLEPLDRAISSVVIDSRQASAGALFVALPGERTDGHLFVEDAFRRGALVALVQREVELPSGEGVRRLDARGPLPHEALVAAHGPICLRVDNSLAALQRLAGYWRDRHPARVVGVTGSVGKTTTKDLIATVLGRRHQVLCSEGNYNNEIGLPLTLLRLDERHEYVVAEMGMYDLGDIALLARLARPQVGVVTNVHPVHLERARTLERIAQAKAELPAALPPAPEGCAVLNHDDPRVRAMAEQTRARVLTYGLQPDADVRATNVRSRGLEGMRFTLGHGKTSRAVALPLLGVHNVYTALAAAAVALAEGLPWSEIVAGLEAPGGPARLIVRHGANGVTLLDDTYNASPASVLAALSVLAEAPGRRVAVLGDMFELGAEEEAGHRAIGRGAASTSQLLVTVGERAQLAAEEARSAGLAPERVLSAPDAGAAIPLLRANLRPGDVVLVKGSRGMHMEVIVDALAAAD
jgi:UDP-N-acetylmuramoyl-tripeptide--D-alanyl-D-alanine ligase